MLHPECPVCFEGLTQAAFKGVCGHSVCAVCFKKLTPCRCPLCRASWKDEDEAEKAGDGTEEERGGDATRVDGVSDLERIRQAIMLWLVPRRSDDSP